MQRQRNGGSSGSCKPLSCGVGVSGGGAANLCHGAGKQTYLCNAHNFVSPKFLQDSQSKTMYVEGVKQRFQGTPGLRDALLDGPEGEPERDGRGFQ